MLKAQKWSAVLGVALLVGCASTGDANRTEVFNDGSRIEYSAAGKPVRFADTSGQLSAVNSSMLVEQVFNDGSRIEYNAAGKPVRVTDASGAVVDKRTLHAMSSR